MANYTINTKGNENLGQGLARELDDFLQGFRPDKRTKRGGELKEARELARKLRTIVEENEGFQDIT